MENRIYKLNDSEFIDLVKSSLNVSEVLFKLGYSTKGNSWGYSEVKRRMTDLNLLPSEFKGKSSLLEYNLKKEISNDQLFTNNSKHSRTTLRSRIIKQSLLPYRCDICGVVKWNDKTLSLEVDHINGINNDNRLENLRLLCPNCHSQTTTYGACNKKITESYYDISDELKDLIINKYFEFNSIEKVSKVLNLKSKAVKQVISNAKLGKSNQKYVIQYDCNMNELNRFGTISECCKYLMINGIVKTAVLKTCRNTLLRNVDKFWNNYYFKIMDA